MVVSCLGVQPLHMCSNHSKAILHHRLKNSGCLPIPTLNHIHIHIHTHHHQYHYSERGLPCTSGTSWLAVLTQPTVKGAPHTHAPHTTAALMAPRHARAQRDALPTPTFPPLHTDSLHDCLPSSPYQP
ncbi:hypothetical protein E2C01_013710 [Portunus trituberculatus]|uniref:Uncharacterized protein n=1 Tax=Portunus trituberculatus TaxID=210409 RepID=A0A5B7DHX9_PORTR|nr:hypothetical protein [Portunus trituberculatus]